MSWSAKVLCNDLPIVRSLVFIKTLLSARSTWFSLDRGRRVRVLPFLPLAEHVLLKKIFCSLYATIFYGTAANSPFRHFFLNKGLVNCSACHIILAQLAVDITNLTKIVTVLEES